MLTLSFLTHILAATPSEPLAQSSRLTSLVISEIMYNPADEGTRLEFIELFNSRLEPEDISGYRLAGSVNFEFPAGTAVPGRGFLVIARAPAAMLAAYDLNPANLFGPWDGAETNSLPNDTGLVQLRHRTGAVFLETRYSSRLPWPVAADGAGHSLVLARPSFGEGDVSAWEPSRRIGGSPGGFEPTASEPLDGVVINEFLANGDAATEDLIELYNTTRDIKDLSGAVLTDNPQLRKYSIPDGFRIGPGGLIHFTASQLGFGLDAGGERILLVNSNATAVIDALDFGPQPVRISTGRTPDGAPLFSLLAARSPGRTNGPAMASPLVINEILYAPASGDDAGQFVELYNPGTALLSLAGWRLTGGISFTFPAGATVGPRSYVVVAKDADRLRSNYGHLGVANCFGNFAGRLSRGGERIALTMPFTNAAPTGTTNFLDVEVDQVDYRDGGRWPVWADGGGSSLELIDPASDNRLPSNWAASDETAKAPWTIISVTGRVDNTSTTVDQLQVLLSGPGECLLDNVEVVTPDGQNRIANATFESGASGWTAEGTESTSGIEVGEGYQSARSYRIRAVERGDNQVNRVRTPLTASIPSGTTPVTIRAATRWLRGAPNILLRLRGNGLECAGELTLPTNPGTPGLPNSSLVPNAPPAIRDVRHQPVLPAAGQNILVTTRIDDPQGVASVQLRFRVDPSSSINSVQMSDDGTGADLLAGDGIYSGSIPGQPAGTLVAFHISALDSVGSTGTFPADAPKHECLVRAGETTPNGTLPIYRFWITQANLSTWNSRSKLDNTPLDVTFVLGSERVIYNATALYAGSPYIAPGYCGANCGRCGYSVSFPSDDRFLGDTDLVLDWPGGHGNENTAIQEQMGYWIADRLGLPYSPRYHIRLHFNGVTDEARRSIFEAVLQPSKRYIEAWHPDNSEGQFFKIDRAFEFSDAGGRTADPQPRLQNYTTEGGLKKREKYRWTWLYRSTQRVHDYTNLFALVDALNAPAPKPYTAAVFNVVDVEQWMRTFAVEHIIVNFDSYGHIIGKNMYSFLPEGGKWQMYMFDLDWLMLVSATFRANYGPLTAPLFDCDDPTITRMYNHPPFLRAYWRAVQDAVDGPLNPAVCNPVMDAKYAALVANGVQWCDNQALAAPTAVKNWFSQRRTGLQSMLASVAAGFSLTGSSVSGNRAILTGTAPVAISTIQFNGQPWPVTWTGVTTWRAEIPMQPGNNALTIAGVDVSGRPISGATLTTNLNYPGTTADPAGFVVINEIMHSPRLQNAEYLELLNRSQDLAFDLSGWRVDGLDYVFPPGSMISPQSTLVLAKDIQAFTRAYPAVPVFDTIRVAPRAGIPIRLVQPASTNPVAAVRFTQTPPWPQGATGTGSSLQLIDPSLDNSRPGNWAVVTTNANQETIPQWVQVTARGTASSSTLYIYLQSPGTIYVDDVSLSYEGPQGAGTNLVSNSGFEAPLAGSWIATASFSQSTISTAFKRSGNSSLKLVATAAGTGSGSSLYQTISPALTNGASVVLSFWYLQTTNGGPLVVRLSNSGTTSGSIDPAPSNALLANATPGRPNSVAGSLPPFPPLWLNEVQPVNQLGITDASGTRFPWIEIYNHSAKPVSLADIVLATNYPVTAPSAFPANAVLQPGEFRLLFASGTPMTSTNGDWTAALSLPAASGRVILARKEGAQFRVLDWLDYSQVPPDRSYGSHPDGQAVDRRDFAYSTPGRPNNAAYAPVSVFINEWMADNSGFLLNPVSQAYDDWFELFNAGSTAADLGGYYLSDSLAEPVQIPMPSGVSIPPSGFLLVWADGRNRWTGTELHVNFKLSKDGEILTLRAPDGGLVDYVTFGAQLQNQTQGRYPDGAITIGALTVPTPRSMNQGQTAQPPILQQPVVIGGNIQFTVPAAPGRRLQLEFRESMAAGSWTPLGTPFDASTPATLEAPVGPGSGFYRLKIVE